MMGLVIRVAPGGGIEIGEAQFSVLRMRGRGARVSLTIDLAAGEEIVIGSRKIALTERLGSAVKVLIDAPQSDRIWRRPGGFPTDGRTHP